MRDRVSRLEMLPASSLVPHPLNWRSHPGDQRELLISLLDSVGFVGAIRAYRDGEKFVIVDGHLRQELSGEQMVPVLILDLTPEEAKLLLLTGDELSSLAETDREATERLLDEVRSSGLHIPASVGELFDKMLADVLQAESSTDSSPEDDSGEDGDTEEDGEAPDNRADGDSDSSPSGERREMTELRFRRYLIHTDRPTWDAIRQSVLDWADVAGTSEGWADAMVDRLSQQLTGE